MEAYLRKLLVKWGAIIILSSLSGVINFNVSGLFGKNYKFEAKRVPKLIQTDSQIDPGEVSELFGAIPELLRARRRGSERIGDLGD